MTYPESNFWAYLQDERGNILPSSFREGHNVFTNFGRNWLAQLAAFQTLGNFPSSGGDVVFTNSRIRWIGVGTGSQLEQKTVTRLVTPVLISNGPDVYIKTIGSLTKPTTFSVRYTTTFSGADFTPSGASVDVSEAGIYVDVDPPGAPGPSLATSSPDHVPVAYKSFPPLTKLLAQTLTIGWEFRF